MRLYDKDVARLWDMLVYAREVARSLSGVTLHAYISNSERVLATERRLEIIGEAARNVSEGFRHAHPEIPWSQIIGLRNILAHEYGEVRQEAIFRIATERVPTLIAALEPLVPPLPDSSTQDR